jgi:hypothetical protein
MRTAAGFELPKSKVRVNVVDRYADSVLAVPE